MVELIECPKCQGTGTVRPPNSETPPTGKTSGIEGNITKFTERIGVPTEKKRSQEFITCPNCNGCGYVRG